MEYVKLINCMRCGMCLPACPTYRETFLETASPRGRVALIRKLQEGELDQSERLLEYLALCLDCQACASACPCGVNAGELVAEFTCERKSETGLGFMEDLILRKLVPHPDRLEASMAPMRMYQRSGLQKLVRRLGVLKMFPRPLERMEGLLPELPARPLRREIQETTPAVGTERGTVGFFLGCVMSLIFSDASRATIKLLSSLGYRVVTPRNQVCCGAPNMLGGDLAGLQEAARTNVEIFGGLKVDFIVTDCGGCGAELKRYGQHLEGDEAAAAFSARVRDISQVLATHADELRAMLKPLDLTQINGISTLTKSFSDRNTQKTTSNVLKVTWHDPCHIAHCQGIRREPRDLLKLVPGLQFAELNEADACCGSAGTYNIERPEMSDLILKRKLDNIAASGAQVVVTGNPGCLLQLKKGLADHLPEVRIMHLTEVLAASMEA
jgi:glycolate oxidase iron-sulfur subunit